MRALLVCAAAALAAAAHTIVVPAGASVQSRLASLEVQRYLFVAGVVPTLPSIVTSTALGTPSAPVSKAVRNSRHCAQHWRDGASGVTHGATVSLTVGRGGYAFSDDTTAAVPLREPAASMVS